MEENQKPLPAIAGYSGKKDTPRYSPPSGWDVADAISEGWNSLRIRELLSEAVPYTEEAAARYPYTGNHEPLALEKTTDATDADAEDWGEPDMSILNPRPPPPKFPVEMFGDCWADWITATAEGCSAPVDYVGMSLLSLSSVLIGCSRCVSPWEGWKEPPLLWIALVGNPSSSKSPALESVLAFARTIEVEAAQDMKEKLRRYEADVMSAQCIRQIWEGEVKEAAKMGVPAPIMPETAQEPEKLQRPRIFVSDTTTEALARLIAGQPKGLLVMRDELSGWMGSFNRYSGGQGGDRAFWLEAYGARPYTIDRARNGGETITVPNLAASILGGIQPDKLHSLLLTGDDDGLTARFLYCWPDPVLPERPQRLADSREAETALRWLNDLSLSPDAHGEPRGSVVTLSEEAATLFQNWRKEHAGNQPEGKMASWWGKMPGVSLRLAINLEYLWIAATTRQENFVVSYAAVKAAKEMIERYLKPMAARAYGEGALSVSERNATRLANWIVLNRSHLINTRELQRTVRLPGMRKAAEIKDAVEILESRVWIRPKPMRAGQTKGRPTCDYIVNPIALSE